jgi:hypothetical protein
MQTSSSLKEWKRLPRAAITASANSAATPCFHAAATSSEVVKPAPLDANLSAAEAVSIVDMAVGLINSFDAAAAGE